MKIRCICIDDSNRPEEVAQSYWPVKGKEYHIIWIYALMSQNELHGCDLAEIHMDDSCFPYVCYKMSRFAIAEEDLAKLLELAKICTEASELTKEFESLIEKEINIEV